MQSEIRSNEELMTPAEVAKLLKVPASTLAVWRSTHRVQIPFIKIGHAVRYVRSDLERILREGTNEAL